MTVKPLLSRVAGDPRVAEVRLADRINRYPFFRTVESASLPEIVIDGKPMVNLGSNNYLGLATDEEAIAVAAEATARWGTGVTGSRLLNGTLTLHHELERRIADFYGKEAALVFPTGYTANLGAIAGLVRRGDRIVADRQVHASLSDGARLSGAEVDLFAHNDLADLAAKYREGRYDLCLVDGVYSMAGDLAPLTELVEMSERYGTALLVDEAHGLGTVGPRGAGAAEAAGLLDRVDLLTITFSKSLGSCGGAVVGSRAVIDALQIRARPFLFTASNTPASLATAAHCLDRLEREPEMVATVNERARYLRAGLADAGIAVLPGDTPIITIAAGSDFRTSQLWRMLHNRGVFCNAVVAPAVARDCGLLRLSVMRTQTTELLDRAVAAFVQVAPLLRGADELIAGLEMPVRLGQAAWG